MKRFLQTLLMPAGVASCVVLPFAFLEFVNTSGVTNFGFPFALFAALWSLAFVSAFGLRQAIRILRAESRYSPSLAFLVGALVLGMVVISGAIIVDQMPCFMGVPNCD